MGSHADGKVLPQMRDDRTAGVDVRLLIKRSVDERPGCAAKPKMLDVADDTDNLPRPVFFVGIRIVAQPDLFSDWILGGEKLLHESLVHDDDPGRGFGIVLLEKSPSLHGNFQRSEKTRSNLLIARAGPLFRRRYGTANN